MEHKKYLLISAIIIVLFAGFWFVKATNASSDSLIENSLFIGPWQKISQYLNSLSSNLYSLTPIIISASVKPEKDGQIIATQEQEFTWGVLAINTNKSIYFPRDRAYLQMTVLDDRGHTVCGAELELRIINQELGIETIFFTEDGTIQRSPECESKSVTYMPDYFAYYEIPNKTGFYEMELTAKTRSGTHEISDSFEVREFVPFEIERIGPTRIYPPSEYEMTLRIKTNQDFVGQVIETTPASFEIQPLDFRFQIFGGEKNIIWDVDWKAGETYELKYTFDAPDINPYLYLLGPLQIGDFQEIRQWQIAADTERVIDSSLYDATDEYNPGPIGVFIDDDTGYVFYVDGGSPFAWSKTTDKGESWSAATYIGDDRTWRSHSVWYDRWTPGDNTGTKIYIASMSYGDDRIHYNYLDTKNDSTLADGSWITARDNIGYNAPDGGASIVKTDEGDIFALGFGDSRGVVRATNIDGSSWTDITPIGFLFDSEEDHAQILPLSGGDILVIYQDESANEARWFVWDYATENWGSNNLLDTWVDGSDEYSDALFGATLHRSTGDVYLAANNDTNAAGSDIKAYKFSDSSRSWSTLTNILTDTAGTLGAKMAINQNNGDLYTVYIRGTVGSSVDIYYKKSTDGGSSWGDETKVNATTKNFYYVFTNFMSDERLYAFWLENSGNDLYGNTIADLIPSQPPTITSVSDDSPKAGLTDITFTTNDAQDTDAEDTIKLYICDSADCASCVAGGATTSCWAVGSGETATGELQTLTASYTCPSCGATTTPQNYYAKVCDNNGVCSGVTVVQTFTCKKEDTCDCICADGACDACFGGYCCNGKCQATPCTPPPIITSVATTTDPIEENSTSGITTGGVSDPENDDLHIYCCQDTNNSCVPDTDDVCNNNQAWTSAEYTSMTCELTAPDVSAATTYYIRCRVYDGTNYSDNTVTTRYVVKESQGSSCSAGDCISGYCVDGYCCDSACPGKCEGCNVAGHLGACWVKPTDDNQDCDGCYYCNGSNTTQQPVDDGQEGKNCTDVCYECNGSGGCDPINNEEDTVGSNTWTGACKYCSSGTPTTVKCGEETYGITCSGTNVCNSDGSSCVAKAAEGSSCTAGGCSACSAGSSCVLCLSGYCTSVGTCGPVSYTADNVGGWAWSKNIGWVSFSNENCDSDLDGYSDGMTGCPDINTPIADYGVDLNVTTGVLSGYAWSSNVGWISFNYSETDAPPAAPDYSAEDYIAKMSTSTYEVSGWGRALVACQDDAWNGTKCTKSTAGDKAGGWDGWIKLRNP